MAKQLVGKEDIPLDESWDSVITNQNELYFDDVTKKYSYYDAATGESKILSKKSLDILTASPNFYLEPTYKIGDTGIEPVPVGYDASETFVQGLFDDPDRGTLYDDPEGQLDPRYERGVTERQDDTDRLLAGGEDPVKQKAALTAARQAELERAQMFRTAGVLGPAAIIGGIDLAISMMDTPLDKRVAERKAEELGKPIIPAEQMAMAQEAAKMTAGGIRAAGREARMRQESVQAAQGVQTSASADVIARREQARRTDEGLAKAGAQYGAQLAGLYAAGVRRKEGVLDAVASYEAKRQMQKGAAVSKFGSDLGKVLGPIVAQSPAKDPGLAVPLGEIAKNSGKLLQPEEYAEISRKLRLTPGLDEEGVAAILTEYELEPTDEAISSLTRRV